jgi:protein-tyrosine phosphatase
MDRREKIMNHSSKDRAWLKRTKNMPEWQQIRAGLAKILPDDLAPYQDTKIKVTAWSREGCAPLAFKTVTADERAEIRVTAWDTTLDWLALHFYAAWQRMGGSFPPQVLQSLQQPGYLGDIQVVSTLLGEFIHAIATDLHPLDPAQSQDQALQRHLAICRRYAEIWAGKNPAYHPQSYHRRSAFLRNMARYASIQADTVEAGVYGLFALFLKQLYLMADALASGQKTDQAIRQEIKQAIEYYTALLMGLPVMDFRETPVNKPIAQCYWVIPGRLLAGEYPRNKDKRSSPEKINALLRAGITTFIDLTEEKELYAYSSAIGTASHQRFPIRDQSVPPSKEATAAILDAIDQSLARGERVYVHCWGGVGRTGLIIGCWLARHGFSGGAALRQLHALWRQCPKSRFRRAPETPEQEEYIRHWQEVRA